MDLGVRCKQVSNERIASCGLFFFFFFPFFFVTSLVDRWSIYQEMSTLLPKQTVDIPGS